MNLVILDYGVGNIKSIQFAFDRLGVTAVLSNDIELIKAADKIIFPGVGEASSAMNKLKDTGLIDEIKKLKQPVLGICLGMQLMCSKLEEGNTTGLGIFDVAVKRFSTSVKVPHMGWNTITNLKSMLFKDISDKFNEKEFFHVFQLCYIALKCNYDVLFHYTTLTLPVSSVYYAGIQLVSI